MADVLLRYLEIDSEDDLTRIVFGCLDLLGPLILNEVLSGTGIESIETPEYRYHEKIDSRAQRTPDVIIEGDASTIMVEAKRGPSLSTDQLREEIDDLQRYGSGQTDLLLVTGHNSKPSKLDNSELGDVKWISWRDFAVSLSEFDSSKLSGTQSRILDMLLQKLQEEGYVPFTGFERSLMETVPDIWSITREYYNQINTFYRDLEAVLGEDRLQAKNLWRDGVSQNLRRFPSDWRFITDHIWIAFGEPDFEISSKHQYFLFVAFCSHGGSEPSVRVGYSLSPGRNETTREQLAENAEEIAKYVEDTEYYLINTSWSFSRREEFTDASEVKQLLTEQDALADLKRVQICTEYQSDDLTNPDLSRKIAVDIREIHDFTYPRLYPEE